MSTPRASKRLPVKPSAEHLRKQAKRLASQSGIELSTAQHRLATEYGARNWAELMHVVETMLRGSVEELARNRFEELPAAANAGDLALVRELLSAGKYTHHDLDLALARAVLRFQERREIAELLLQHGADPDGQYGSNYGPIIFVTGECLDVGGLRFLIDAGADVTFAPVSTKYGEQCPLSMWLGSYLRGRNAAKREGIDLLLRGGAHVPAELAPELLAIHRDDRSALRAMLAQDSELPTRAYETLPYVDCPGGTLLHYACEFGASECIDLLLRNGALVNAISRNGLTPLHCAVHGCDADTVRRLLDQDASPWIEDQHGRPPARHVPGNAINPQSTEIERLLTAVIYGDEAFGAAVAAIDSGDLERLTHTLRSHPHLVSARAVGGDAITRGYFSRPTLLHFIACNPSRGPHMPPNVVDSARAILDAGAEVDASTGAGQGGTTLALVASSATAHADGLVVPLLELLLRAGADPTHGLTAAIFHRYVDTARVFLRLGARQTLISAAALGFEDQVTALLEASDNEQKLRAAWAAAVNGQARSLEVLVRAGVDVNSRLPRPYEPTLLHEAASHGHSDAVRALLALGADPTLRDTQFQGTPADWALHANHPEVAALCGFKH